MKAEVLNSFIDSTREVLRTMVGLDPERGDPRVKGFREKSYDVSGVVGLTGQIRGFVVLSFPEKAALHVVTAFLGERVNSIDEQVRDAIGELSNMVAGGSKRVLAEAGYQLRVSIPSVIVGTNHTISRPRGLRSFEVPFVTEVGPFSVELCLKLEQ